MIRIRHKGNFKHTENFLSRALKPNFRSILERYGQEGVSALAESTPKDTGLTAASWNYIIEEGNGKTTITWTNSNLVNGVSIAVILQYGHGTRNGGYVQGRDYINPAIRPIFDKISQAAWKEVVSA